MPQYYEIIDGGENNVYHFLFYMISNFLIANIAEEIVYYYPNKKNCAISEGFLALLPANFHRHYEKENGRKYISFMNAIPIFKDTALPESYHLIRKLFAQSCSNIRIGKRLYILRVASSRSFYNEYEVSNLMKAMGFEIVQLENYSILEQIRMFSEAEVVCGAHGAGLAFTVFCGIGARIIEIYGLPETESRHYLHIAHILGFPMHRFKEVIMCDDAHNMIVDTSAFESFLRGVLKN